MKQFTEECLKKFKRTAKEKGRTLTPWDDNDFDFLFARLVDEVSELFEVKPKGKKIKVTDIQDECKDIALFAWFIYKKTPPTRKEEEE
jgi:NTP pyrophosphatase (non-canonical NTP hydrolase)